jgi:hypothetical protein
MHLAQEDITTADAINTLSTLGERTMPIGKSVSIGYGRRNNAVLLTRTLFSQLWTKSNGSVCVTFVQVSMLECASGALVTSK